MEVPWNCYATFVESGDWRDWREHFSNRLRPPVWEQHGGGPWFFEGASAPVGVFISTNSVLNVHKSCITVPWNFHGTSMEVPWNLPHFFCATFVQLCTFAAISRRSPGLFTAPRVHSRYIYELPVLNLQVSRTGMRLRESKLTGAAACSVAPIFCFCCHCHKRGAYLRTDHSSRVPELRPWTRRGGRVSDAIKVYICAMLTPNRPSAYARLRP